MVSKVNGVVRVLISSKNHYGLIFSDNFVRFLNIKAPELLDRIEPELMDMLVNDDREMLAEHPDWMEGYSTVEEYVLGRYHFTQLEDGRVVQPKWDMTIVRTHPEVLQYVTEHGSASFVEPEVPFEIVEIPLNKFAGVYEEDDGSECISYVHPSFVRN